MVNSIHAQNLARGELALLASKATVLAYAKSSNAQRTGFMLSGQKKVTLKAENVGDLYEKCAKINLNVHMVEKDGKQLLLAVGPNNAVDVDHITGKLKLV